jgi:hypothetical protein
VLVLGAVRVALDGRLVAVSVAGCELPLRMSEVEFGGKPFGNIHSNGFS